MSSRLVKSVILACNRRDCTTDTLERSGADTGQRLSLSFVTAQEHCGGLAAVPLEDVARAEPDYSRLQSIRTDGNRLQSILPLNEAREQATHTGEKAVKGKERTLRILVAAFYHLSELMLHVANDGPYPWFELLQFRMKAYSEIHFLGCNMERIKIDQCLLIDKPRLPKGPA